MKENGIPQSVHRKGFTLLEALISCALLLLLLVLVMSIMSHASDIWLRHRNEAVAFESARSAFTAMTKSVSQAVLNTYWEVRSNRYERASELHMVIGPTADLFGGTPAYFPGDGIFFQAPLGRASNKSLNRLPLLLNSVGYYVRFSDRTDVPSFLRPVTASRFRFRLYEWMEPTESLSVYSGAQSTAQTTQRDWFRKDFSSGSLKNSAVFAENIIGLIFLAEYPDSNGAVEAHYGYDSRNTSVAESLHQLPPTIRIVMVAIDEKSATRLEQGSQDSPPDVVADPAWFQRPEDFDSDLEKWESKLRGMNVGYRVFNTTVSVQNAKWSRS